MRVLLIGLFLALYLLYIYGYLPVSQKRAVMFMGQGGIGQSGMGASFTSCTGKIHRIIRFRESRSYSFLLDGHVQQGSVRAELLDSHRAPVVTLTADAPSAVIPVRKGERYYLYIYFDRASGDYRVEWT